MSISNKLEMVLNIKNQIKNEIRKKGVVIEDSTPFNEYPAKIELIMGAVVDTTPPILENVSIVVEDNNSLTVSGKTESNATVTIKNPNDVIYTIAVSTDGSFNTNLLVGVVNGSHILTATDSAGNSTTQTVNVIFKSTNDTTSLIQSIFDTGAKGLWYDPNDFSTMFQDVDMKIPVTAVGQSVSTIVSKNNNGCRISVVNASKCPRLQYNPISKNHYLLYDGVDDNLSVSGLGSVPVDTQHLTFFNSYKMLSDKGSGFQVAGGTVSVRTSTLYGMLEYTVTYNNAPTVNHVLKPYEVYTYPFKQSYAFSIDARGQDKCSINGEIINTPTKNTANFKTISFNQPQSTNDCINQEFYGVIIFDKKLTDEQFQLIEAFMSNKV